jgi:hypothetical protein
MQNLEGQKFKDDLEVETVVIGLLITQARARCHRGIETLVPPYNRCLNCGKDYVEK